ncbi:MAG: hypothetical protein IPM92_03015 [Saprospiraceae bacterium]|nr:hypothetical protein [Saprospiraceae bacterium]
MTIEKYLQDLLKSQDLTEQQEEDLQKHKKEITDYLRKEFGNDPIIKYAGSREKGTMISERYDLDVVCYFPSSDDRSLKEIREDVAHHLEDKYELTHKSSSERIMDLKGSQAPVDFHIDVVPGRFIEDTKDVFLHVAYGDKQRMQTNLRTHIDHIKDSGCVEIIRLVKLWAHRNDLKIKTFILELFIVKVLTEYKDKGNLQKSFLKVLEEFNDRYSTIQLIDPANTNNVVSKLVSDSEKESITQMAKRTYTKIENSDDLSDWKETFVDNDSNSSSKVASTSAYTVGSSFQPSKPWSNDYR